MAKETSNKPFKPIRFNEQVNVVLLIMFLTVAIIISLKGCGTCLIDRSQNIKNVTTDKIVAEADSTMSDSTAVMQE